MLVKSTLLKVEHAQLALRYDGAALSEQALAYRMR